MINLPHYLNEEDLGHYIAELEQGLRASGTSRSQGSSNYGGRLGYGSTYLEAGKGETSEETVEVDDHSASRLKRLIEAGHNAPEETGWIEANQPDVDFNDAAIGAFVEWECDVYVPETIAAISNSGDMAQALNMMKSMRPSAEALGLSLDGLPDERQADAAISFLDHLDTPTVVVGDDADTDWKVVGPLDNAWITSAANFEGRARVIGKVQKVVGPDRWHPIFALPGMNVVSRDERRRMERYGPKDEGEKDQFIRGPLLVVRYLAITT